MRQGTPQTTPLTRLDEPNFAPFYPFSPPPPLQLLGPLTLTQLLRMVLPPPRMTLHLCPQEK